jgi:hypothetical protein
MSGSSSAFIVIPIVALSSLAVLLIMVFCADRHPRYGHTSSSCLAEGFTMTKKLLNQIAECLQKLRPLWSIVILALVGWASFRYYRPHSMLDTFYSTAAVVIASLYVAIVLTVFATKESAENKMTFEHWVFTFASSVGLLASLRGLSVGDIHDAWKLRLLTGLTVAGVTAAVLMVAERLITLRGGAGRPRAFIWTVLFILAAIILVFFP